MRRTALFSECRTWRYALNRVWGDAGNLVQFIGLNPSTADEEADDPTVRRCIGYAQAWGYDGMVMTNLFAYRSTDPVQMILQGPRRAIGPDNDQWLLAIAGDCHLTVAAWGNQGRTFDRDKAVRKAFKGVQRLHVLKLTGDGHPGHPLYLSKTLEPFVWQA